MKADLERLMTERGLDAVMVTGASVGNPPMYYMSNGARVGESTILVQRRGAPAVLIVSSLERDEAARSGLRVIVRDGYDPLRLLNEEGGSRLRFAVRLFEAIFSDLRVTGAVGLYGRRDQSAALALAEAFNQRGNGARLVGEFTPTLFDAAWVTKDPEEVARIRAAGRKTMTVVGKTAEFLRSHRAEEGHLVRRDDRPLLIGDVKREIRRWLAEEGLEDPEGVIFAVGRDAGVPHSEGDDAHPIPLGQTIVFDLFPREGGGGYFYDVTRTWCMGFAPPEIDRVHADVLWVFESLMRAVRVGDASRALQRRACALFEARGHPTFCADPKTTRGFVHSLGHGLGLNVHESPHFYDAESNTDVLAPGCVVTIEPGLYYPDDGGFGVRIEDTVWMNPATGRGEPLAEFSTDLVLPVRGGSTPAQAGRA